MKRTLVSIFLIGLLTITIGLFLGKYYLLMYIAGTLTVVTITYAIHNAEEYVTQRACPYCGTKNPSYDNPRTKVRCRKCGRQY